MATSLKDSVSNDADGTGTPFLAALKRRKTSGSPGMSLKAVIANLKWNEHSAAHVLRASPPSCSALSGGRSVFIIIVGGSALVKPLTLW